MTWTNQEPPATDVLLHTSMHLKDAAAVLEIDRLQSKTLVPQYRLTVGDLFSSAEAARSYSLDALLRQANRLLACTRVDQAQDILKLIRKEQA